MSQTNVETVIDTGRIAEQSKAISKILEHEGVFTSHTTLDSFVDRVCNFAPNKFLNQYVRDFGLTFHTRTCIVQLDMKLANVSTNGSRITLYPEISECKVVPSGAMRISHRISVQICEEISENIKLAMGFEEYDESE